MKTVLKYLIILCVCFVLNNNSQAWSKGHCRITKGAFDNLPQWQKEFIGAEKEKLINEYCLYPDWYSGKTRKMVAPYIMPKLKNGLTMKLLVLHCKAAPELNYEVCHYYIYKILKMLQNKHTKQDGIKFLGTFLHYLEDRCTPAHIFAEDILWLDIKQFIPPPTGKETKFFLMHSLLEDLNQEYKSSPSHSPQLMGTNPEEVIYTLEKRLHNTESYVKSTVIPIIEAAYAEDKEKRRNLQLKVAYKTTELIADFMYTMIHLSQSKTQHLETASTQLKTSPQVANKLELKDVINKYKKLFSRNTGYATIAKAALQVLNAKTDLSLNTSDMDFVQEYACKPENTIFTIQDIPDWQNSSNSINEDSIHMPINPLWDKKMFEAFAEEACKNIRKGNMSTACKFLGILAHCIIDRNTPTDLYKRNYYCLQFKELLPPPKTKKKLWETSSFYQSTKPVSITGYKPVCLGVSLEEIAFRLQCRLRNVSLPKARKDFIPLLRAHYQSNIDRIAYYQNRCAEQAAKDVADLIYSIICLSNDNINQASQHKLRKISLLNIPEVNLYKPQKSWAYNLAHHHWQWQWHIPNYVGRLWKNRSGGYKNQKPLELRQYGKIIQYKEGFSQTADYGHTFLIPKGIFSSFNAVIGPDATISGDAEFYFIVKLDSKEVYKSQPFSKDSSQQEISIELGKAESLSLFIKKIRGKVSDIHAIWAKPTLKKTP